MTFLGAGFVMLRPPPGPAALHCDGAATIEVLAAQFGEDAELHHRGARRRARKILP
jgi:hypothetical protein